MFLSCHVLLPFSSLFFSLFLGLAFDPGTHGIQIGTEFLFWTHKVMALRVPGLDLQIPDVLYIEIETFTSHPWIYPAMTKHKICQTLKWRA
jgi:hypothetical protein